MMYRKLFKIASLLDERSPFEANLLRKLASESSFRSLILGSYPTFSGNENEAKIRKARAIHEINDDSKAYASVSALANIINTNPDIKNSMSPEGHIAFWKGEGDKNLKPALHDELSKILLSPQASPQSGYGYQAPPREERRGPQSSGSSSWLAEIEKAVRIYLQNIKDINMAIRALSEQKSVLIPRSMGRPTLGRLSTYNSLNKEATFLFPLEDGDLGRKTFILNDSEPGAVALKELNQNYSHISSIRSPELNGLFAIGPIPRIRIPRSDGSETFGIIISHGYKPGQGYTVTTSFSDQLGGATKDFDEASGSLGYFMSMNPDLMGMGKRR